MYCYNVMSFGLKKFGATYQRIMERMFELLIGKTIEVYIDNMLVKLESWDDHLTRQNEAFQFMRQH